MVNEKNNQPEQDQYLASGVHMGLKFKTKYLKDFIFKVRPDGLAIFDVQKIVDRIKIAARFLSYYEPEDILVVCRRENGQRAVKAFCKVTGAKSFAGRYLPGLMTNTFYEEFFEPKLLVVCDPWPDKNAINDALKLNIPIVSLVDTNNTTNNIDLIIPCNNKGKKSLGMIFYSLAKEYLVNKGLIKGDQELEIPFFKFYKLKESAKDEEETKEEREIRSRSRPKPPKGRKGKTRSKRSRSEQKKSKLKKDRR